MPISLTVLIPTHGRATLLGRTLASLGACRLPEGYAETVVVENGSRAGAEAVVAEAAAAHPALRLRYLHVERANKSHALNEALKLVEGGLVVFFDDDVRLEAEVLEAYAAAAAEHPERTFFGGPLESDFEARPPDWLLRMMPASVQGFTLADAAARGYYLGANWAAYAADLAAVGGFDPNFGPGSPSGSTGQETNIQRRLRDIGVEGKNVDRALVWHFVPRQFCTVAWMLHRRYRGGVESGQRARWEGRSGVLQTRLVGLARGALAVSKQTLLRNPAGRIVALQGLYENVGAVRGYWSGVKSRRR